LSAGVYNNISITESGCSSVADIDVTLSDPSIPTLSGNAESNPTACSGTDGSITLTTGNLSDGTYTLDYEDGSSASQAFSMVVSGNVGTISGLSAGVYNNISITESGCSSVADIDVTLSDPSIP
ncbi:hypothetical protein, partial [Reichenbachiella sp. MALMAid0571]|uniref:hypothetical protein n=1 Tax=Reichenbachiella sp. MALMAid0571 TaxID=3143939 RepID=UPI0032DE3C29